MDIHNTLPMADAIPTNFSEYKLNKQIVQSNLTGLANNVKWNKLIKAMRSKNSLVISYRYKWINGYVSQWDMEWYYHLPFPFKGVLWFDMSYPKTDINRLTREAIIDSSNSIITLLKSIGFEYEINNNLIRIFGYSPKDYSNFN
jgi:hypothetical protein